MQRGESLSVHRLDGTGNNENQGNHERLRKNRRKRYSIFKTIFDFFFLLAANRTNDVGAPVAL